MTIDQNHMTMAQRNGAAILYKQFGLLLQETIDMRNEDGTYVGPQACNEFADVFAEHAHMMSDEWNDVTAFLMAWDKEYFEQTGLLMSVGLFFEHLWMNMP